MYCSNKPGFLEYWWVFFFFFFTFWRQLFHLFLARLGIPVFGNKVIPSWRWRSPSDHFFLFLSQAENDLPPHGHRLAGTEPGPLIEERTWLCTLLLPLSLPPSFYLTCLLPPYTDCVWIVSFLSPFPSHWSAIYFFFHRRLYPLHRFLPPFPTSTLSSPVFQMIPRYSSYSPEDALIPHFPPQSTDCFKRVQRRWRQNRFANLG